MRFNVRDGLIGAGIVAGVIGLSILAAWLLAVIRPDPFLLLVGILVGGVFAAFVWVGLE